MFDLIYSIENFFFVLATFEFMFVFVFAFVFVRYSRYPYIVRGINIRLASSIYRLLVLLLLLPYHLGMEMPDKELLSVFTTYFQRRHPVEALGRSTSYL